MRFARWVFGLGALYGVVLLMPALFLEGYSNTAYPPAITHPEFYYGFFGLALVWQIVFVMIAHDPMRWRPLMLVGALEKLAFFAPCLALYLAGRMQPTGPFIGAMVDGVLMLLFIAAWFATRPAAKQEEATAE